MIEVLTGAGFAAAVALVLVKFLVDFVRRQQVTIENHIKHQTEATQEMIGAVRDMREVIKENTQTLRAFREFMYQQGRNR